MHQRTPRLTTLSLAGLLWMTANSAAAHPGPDGEVSSHHNEVETKPKAEMDWQAAAVGQEIFKNGRVATRADSRAAVQMRDTSSVSLRENTLLIIYGHHAERNKKLIAMEATLETGALRSRLGDLAGGQRARIETPSATTTQEGGEALIKVDAEGTSRVHNHGGGRLGVKGQRGGRVKVDKGTGRKVKKGKRPEKPVPLPPAPVWKAGVNHFLALPGHLGTIYGSWEKVDGAANYFVEVATDAAGVNVIAAVLVPGNIERFEVRGLAPGEYHVRVAAVDDDKFESLPSAAYAAKLDATKVQNADGATMRWETDAEGNERPVFVGAGRIELPEGVSCEFGEVMGEGLVARDMGEAPPCTNAAGDPVAGFPFSVLRPQIAVLDAEAIDTVRGESSRHVVELSSDHGVDALAATLPAGYEQVTVTAREDGNFELSLHAGPSAPDSGKLELHLGGPEGPVLGELEIRSRDAEGGPPKPPSKRERHMVELGVGGFGAWMNDEHGLFEPGVGHSPFSAPVAGGLLTLGYFPIRWAGIELDSRLGQGRGESGKGTFWSLRGQVVGQLPYRVTPTAQIGFDLFGIKSGADFVGDDTDIGFHWGLGAKAYLTKRIALNLGLNHLAYEGLGDGPTNHLEVYGGVRFVIGRQSAGRRGQ